MLKDAHLAIPSLASVRPFLILLARKSMAFQVRAGMRSK